jgi:hypothetical protein
VQKNAPSEAQTLLHIVDDDYASCTGRLKNLVLVRRFAGTGSTTNTLDHDLAEHMSKSPLDGMGEGARCSR